MDTTKLTKTNLISPERAAIIEMIIGVEITDVITQRHTNGLVISPYDNTDSIRRKITGYVVKNITFDCNTGVLTYATRNRWQRSFSLVRAQGQPIGYKLPTTKINEGFIWGNFIFSK